MAKKRVLIELKNLPKVKIALKKLTVKKAKNLNQLIHRQGARLIEEVMDSIAGNKSEPASVDTGQFKTSIGKDSRIDRFMQADIKSDLDYPVYLEDGTTKIKPRRHFGNSFRRRLPFIEKEVKEL